MIIDRKAEHLAEAESYFVYINDFDFEDDKKIKWNYEKRMWLELLYASMSERDYKAIKNLPDMIQPSEE
jgi:hypothetical protein